MNTMQQEFDAVVSHLRVQGRPALDSRGLCQYRTADGMMCAVGCRIPATAYQARMENKTVTALVQGLTGLPEEIPAYLDMFDQLQSAHDSDKNLNSDGTFSYRLEDNLKDISAANGLIYTAPVTA